MYGEWLERLKEGDAVIVANGFSEERLAKVDRLTATQIVVGNSRYQRRSGRMVGADTYSRCSLYEATPERSKRVRKKTLAYMLANYKWHDYALEDLETVWRAVKIMTPPATASEKQT